VAPAYLELLERPFLAGRLLKSLEEISSKLGAGAAGVSTSHQKLWHAP
jgi:glycerol-3-phosphate responsive antiterminator